LFGILFLDHGVPHLPQRNWPSDPELLDAELIVLVEKVGATLVLRLGLENSLLDTFVDDSLLVSSVENRSWEAVIIWD